MPGAAETTPPGHPLHGTAPRHKVVALCFLASIICYAARFNLSVCIIAMATEYRWSKGVFTSLSTLLISFSLLPARKLTRGYGCDWGTQRRKGGCCRRSSMDTSPRVTSAACSPRATAASIHCWAPW